MAATIEELRAWRAEVFGHMATGVLRVSFQGRMTEFRTLQDMQRTIALLDQQIAALEAPGKVPVRVVYSPGAKHL